MKTRAIVEELETAPYQRRPSLFALLHCPGGAMK